MTERKKNTVDLMMNLAVAVSTVAAVISYFTSGPDILGSSGIKCFKYFTTDSNVLCALASAVYFCYNVKRLRHPDAKIPKWTVIFKFVGTVSVCVTLLTVVFFLAPIGWAKGGFSSFLLYFKGNVFALHFSTPVIAAVSFILLEKDHRMNFRDSVWTLLPTVIYSVIYLVMVVFIKKWEDWYGFTFGGKLYLAPAAMLAMYALTMIIAGGLRKLRKD